MQPNEKITISLDAQQWQGVVNLLVEGPYRLAAPLIQAMQEQFNVQAQTPQPMSPDASNGATSAVSNGADRAH